MNPEETGKKIKEIRLSNKMSQQQFATQYGVTYQAVSKWENGKNMPDITILKKICDDFNIDINTFLEKEPPKKDKRKIILIISIAVIALIIITSIIISLYHDKNEDNFDLVPLAPTCDNFKLYGSMAHNKQKTSIYISNITYCGPEDKNDYKKIECILYEQNGKTKTEINRTNYNKKETIKLDNFLETVEFNVDNFNKTCELLEEGSLHIEIEATTSKDKVIKYEIPIKLDDTCKK